MMTTSNQGGGLPHRPLFTYCHGLLTLAIALLALGLGGCRTFGDDPDFSDIVRDIALCDAAKDLLVADMEAQPLFRSTVDGCSPLTADQLDDQPDDQAQGELFADADCLRSVSFQGTEFRQFCLDNLVDSQATENFIGNPEAWSERDPSPSFRFETPWSLSHGSRLEFTSVDQTLRQRPYVKKLEYRRIGKCSLGMHVYTRHPEATGLRTAMVIHGGGWSRRGLGAIGAIETTAPELTARGYVVFAPFYRLLDSNDGPAACQNASGDDILNDMDAALAWVGANAAAFGAEPATKITLLGQSAGGHLAAYLATNQPAQIERGILLYPPTDLAHFIVESRPGGLYEAAFDNSVEELINFLDASGDIDDPGDLNVQSAIARRASFPPSVATSRHEPPPMVMLHGDSDQNVPVEQCLRLCDAYAGVELTSSLYEGGDLDRDCGPSRLHIIAGADHILDQRCVSGQAGVLLQQLGPDLGQRLCPVGSEAGEQRVRELLTRAYDELGPVLD